MLKAIIFDLDDTLIDWGDFQEDWESTDTPHVAKVYDYICGVCEVDGDFAAFKDTYFELSKNAWMNARTTLKAPHLGRVLVDAAHRIGASIDVVDMQALLTAYEWGIIRGTTAFPEARKVLTQLQAKGIKMGIVTNAFAPMALRDVELSDHGLLEFFPECRISAADFGYLKPHPGIFRAALDCLGTSPEETIFIGDNPTADIAGAQVAGMRAVLRVIKRPRPLISGLIIPDAALNTLEELPAILDRWYAGWDNVAR
jgi:HAD superfamily hydrolase (TIGR01549 family)